jgi:hypothetical protein
LLSYKEEAKIEKTKENLSDFEQAFLGTTLAKDEDEDEEEDEEVFFFLDEENEKVFEIYKIAKDYLGEYYKLPSDIILALIKEEGLPLAESLQKIPLIHSGFINVIMPKEEKNGE